MKRALLVTSLTAALTATIAAQQPVPVEPPAMVQWTAQAGGIARTALETRVTRGQPYSGEAVTEFLQVLADGNRIVRRTTARLYRDS